MPLLGAVSLLGSTLKGKSYCLGFPAAFSEPGPHHTVHENMFAEHHPKQRIEILSFGEESRKDLSVIGTRQERASSKCVCGLQQEEQFRER